MPRTEATNPFFTIKNGLANPRGAATSKFFWSAYACAHCLVAAARVPIAILVAPNEAEPHSLPAPLELALSSDYAETFQVNLAGFIQPANPLGVNLP